MYSIRLVDIKTRGKDVSKFVEVLDDIIDFLALKWPLQSAESKEPHSLALVLRFQVVFQLVSKSLSCE
jgi:hypothetical protein